MADLDDFFAKKDKKKSKAKPKILATEAVLKRIIEPKRELHEAKQTEPENVRQPTLPAQEAKAKTTDADEEEWKDFEEEQRKDYTGLKIGQLTINDDDDDDDEDDEEHRSLFNDDENFNTSDGNAGGNGGISKRGGPMAWKKLIPAEEVTQIPMEPEKPSSKIYISPALRAQNQSIATRAKSRRTAPNITNADYFPSLDAARPERQRKKKHEPTFEQVRHGGRAHRVEEGSQSTPPAAAASNRFQYLDEED